MFKYLSLLFIFISTFVSAITVIIQIPHNDENALANGITAANNNPNDKYILEIFNNDGFGFVISKELPIVTGNVILRTKMGGGGFNASEIGFQPWGTLTLEYQPGCTLLNMAYASTVSGFGSGTHPYQKLTQPAGMTCACPCFSCLFLIGNKGLI